MSQNEQTAMMEKARHAGERVAHIGEEAARLKTAVSHAVGDAVAGGRQLAVRGRHAAENFANDTAERVKREPLRSVAATFAIGFGVGALAGCLVWRKAVSNSGRVKEN